MDEVDREDFVVGPDGSIECKCCYCQKVSSYQIHTPPAYCATCKAFTAWPVSARAKQAEAKQSEERWDAAHDSDKYCPSCGLGGRYLNGQHGVDPFSGYDLSKTRKCPVCETPYVKYKDKHERQKIEEANRQHSSQRLKNSFPVKHPNLNFAGGCLVWLLFNL